MRAKVLLRISIRSAARGAEGSTVLSSPPAAPSG